MAVNGEEVPVTCQNMEYRERESERESREPRERDNKTGYTTPRLLTPALARIVRVK